MSKNLHHLCVHVCLCASADRCSVSPLNRMTSAHTQQALTAISTQVTRSLSDSIPAFHRRISSHPPVHSSGLYVSLLLAPAAPSGPPGDNRLLGCHAAEPSWDGRGDNVCPSGDRPGTEGEIGKQSGGIEKRKRQARAEVMGFNHTR